MKKKYISLLLICLFVMNDCIVNSTNKVDLPLAILILLGTQKIGRYGHSTVDLGKDKVLILGGQNGYIVFNDILTFDADSNSIIQTGLMRTGRSNFKAVQLFDGRIFIAGGLLEGSSIRQTTQFSNQTEVYDPIANFSIPGPNLSQGRSDFTLNVLNDGRVLISGGRSFNILKSAELFDPASMTIISVGNMNFNRFLHTSTKLNDGRVVLIGGQDNEILTNGIGEIFDPVTLNFTTTGAMGVSRVLHSANLLPNNNIIITGGYKVATAPFASNTKVIEIYNPGTNSFSNVGSIQEYRSGHSASLTQNNSIVLCGGEQILTSIPVLSSCEIYDLNSYAPIGKGEMLTKRALHASSSLSKNRIVLFSGFDKVDLESGIPNALKISEVYDYSLFTSKSVNGSL